jgi:SAM-dependent methyltransferase
MGVTDSNEAERRRWNDPGWATAWPKRERLTAAVTDLLLAEARLQTGEKVLDVGSGGGLAALAAGRVVGDGAVVGADISAPLVQLARQRGAAQGATNVSFAVADVQQETVPGGPFDAAISQFGVMFFDEPEVAFANIRRQLVSGGRLAFACWSDPDLNRWFPRAALATFLPPPPPPAPGKSAAHPFSLSDPDHVAGILEASGWHDVMSIRHDLVVTIERNTIVDDEALGFFGVPADSFPAAWEAIERQLRPITRDDGLIDAPLAFQIVTATA